MASSDKMDTPIMLATMTPFQEYMNAISMIGPTICCLYFCYERQISDFSREHDKLVMSFCVGTALHMPFSVVYHVRCALCQRKDRLENNLRCLDQTFIAVASIFFAFALTGSLQYSFICLLYNAATIYRLWTGRTMEVERKKERRLTLALGVMMYLIPIALMRGSLAFIKCFLTFFASAFAFAKPDMFRGFGSLIFHIGMAPYCMFLLEAIPTSFVA
jgi:hypothetical protein